MKYLWEGRLGKGLAACARRFSDSLVTDRAMAACDIRGSVAHAEMLAARGIIPRRDAAALVRGLRRVAREIAEGTFRFAEGDEDIHTAVERRLTELCGEAGGRIHTARSRNDQVALDERLYLRDALAELDAAARELQSALVAAGERTFPAVMPGYTHLQRGQPVLLAHHLLAYVEMLARDRERIAGALGRVDVLPLGACACAGTSLPIDRALTARLLGFPRVSANSLDTVSDRDHMLETASVVSILMVHLSRLAEDLVLWSSAEFAFVELPDEFCTGSSLMPQKKNPDIPELIRGKAASALGASSGLFCLMKGLPLSYNRDLQEDKRPVFAMLGDAVSSLRLLSAMFPGIRFDDARMLAAASSGFLWATDAAEYLVRRGVPFRTAHGVCGRLVRYCIGKKKDLPDLSAEELRRFSPAFGPDVRALFEPRASAAAKRSAGGTAPDLVRKELRTWKRRLSKKSSAAATRSGRASSASKTSR